MAGLILLLLQVFVQVYVIFFETKKVGRGKIITIPMRAVMAKMLWRKLEQHKRLIAKERRIRRAFMGWMTLAVFLTQDGFFRVLQIMGGLAILFLGDVTSGSPWFGKGFSIWIIVLYADDYFTADDDWKKRWEAAKNKVKWLWTPAMEPRKNFG